VSKNGEIQNVAVVWESSVRAGPLIACPTRGLMSLHAFGEQLRFVKGGEANLPPAFWGQNGDDVAKVKRTLTHLLHGGGEFVEGLHGALYDRRAS
jgi:hypothetical protein